jgi:adenylate cyclase
MFTDIVGFTALGQSSEADALRLLERHNQLLRPFFLRFRGREVKTMGDAFLVEFDSALDATTCAVEIQRSLRATATPSAGPPPIRIRIGIHLGDVVATEGDVLGDAVNIASRIEPLAEPGGVCVSGPVYDQVHNKVDLQFERVDAPELKNVQMPIPVYRIVFAPLEGAAGSGAEAVDPPRRLAVLPLTNMSPDPQDEFFADGLTEEIITELSRISGIGVIARTSVMRYKSVTKPVREIGAELHVGYVLEGSLRKAGNRIRITVQLIDARTEEHLWADRLDRELADIFAVQSEIASSVAAALDLRLRPTLIRPPAAPPDVGAYTLYLRGRYLWNQRTNPSVREAARRFQEAIALDPRFALAHSGLADSYSVLADRGALPRSESIPRALAEARRGLELDPSSAEVHASLGLALSGAGDDRAAERELRTAIRLNPGYPAARLWLQLVLQAAGRPAEAEQEIRLAEELDPLSPAVLNSAGVIAWAAGRNDEAIAKWERARELVPTTDSPTLNLVALLALSGRREEAVARLTEYEEGAADLGPKLWVGMFSYAVLGDRAKVEERLERIRALPEDQQFPRPWYGLLWGMLGDLDPAFEILLDPLDPIVGSFRATLRILPSLAKVRADPRFESLVRQWELDPSPPTPAAETLSTGSP